MSILLLHLHQDGAMRQPWVNNGQGQVAPTIDGYVRRNRTEGGQVVNVPGWWFAPQRNSQSSSQDVGFQRGIVAPLRFDVMAFNQGPGRVRMEKYIGAQDLGLKVAEYQ